MIKSFRSGSKIGALAIAIFSLAGALNAAQVNNGNAAIGNGVGLLNGTLDPVGSLIRIGTFTGLNATQIRALQFNPTALNAAFTEFGITTIGAGNPFGTNPPTAGYWSASTINNTTATAFVGQQIYYWIFNASTLATSTQYGVFTAPGNTNWVFPADVPTPGITTTDLSNVPNTTAGIVIGSFGTGSAFGFPEYNLAAVPEPSTYALALVGVGTLVAFVRRKATA